jgi:hypothetical protein
MGQDKQPIQKPDLNNLEMHMPEGDMNAPEVTTGKKVTSGPILLLLVFALVFILGGMFWWYSTIFNTPASEPVPLRPTAEQNNEPESTTAEARTANTAAVGTSDELSAIEADLASTNIETLEADFAAIESVLDNPNP